MKIDYEVVVIGGGFAGIGSGIKLKESGIDSFVILEKGDDIGGVWYFNTYPGIAVDITSFTYSFSFEQNPNWSRVFAPGSELKAYADHCVEKYELMPHVKLHTGVEKATYLEDHHAWEVETSDGNKIVARYIMSCTGPLTQPKMPDIEGLDSFEGKLIHTARWDHDYDLKDKRVGIIGTGATSVQLVPSIAPLVKKLSVFQRTPIWIIPKPDAEIPDMVKKAFRRIPGLQTGVRLATNLATEMVMVFGIVYNKQIPQLVKATEQRCMRHMKSQIKDPELREKLTPAYGLGCKRPSFSNEYYPAFNRDNVELVTEGIEKITKKGIVTKDGQEHEIDVLIAATGFKLLEAGNMPAYELYGLEGRELGNWWEENRYQAYEGITVPKFPNYFIISFGPHSAGGASWFSIIEAHTTHALRCIKAARRKQSTEIEIKQEAHDRYFEKILEKQKNTVMFNNDCSGANSYYFAENGDSPFLRPSPGIEMWWQCRNFPLRDYVFS